MEISLDPASNQCGICASGNLKAFEATAYDVVSPDVVSIVECRDCGFAWQYPLRRSEAESVQHFDKNYALQGDGRSDYFKHDRKIAIAQLELGFVQQLPIQGNNLLDLGAGAGMFAEVASANGFTVTALDPALDGALVADNKNITAIRGTVESLPKHEMYDVITMWDVIEHMTTPVEILRQAKMHLKPGGWLVVETGNYKSTARVRGGLNHWIYQQDHRWYFSPESMTQVLESLGFTEIIRSQKTLRPGWEGKVGYAGPSLFELLKSVSRQPQKSRARVLEYLELSRAKTWSMPGIEIFALAAKRPIQD